jgi:hypothetical protein
MDCSTQQQPDAFDFQAMFLPSCFGTVSQLWG